MWLNLTGIFEIEWLNALLWLFQSNYPSTNGDWRSSPRSQTLCYMEGATSCQPRPEGNDNLWWQLSCLVLLFKWAELENCQQTINGKAGCLLVQFAHPVNFILLCMLIFVSIKCTLFHQTHEDNGVRSVLNWGRAFAQKKDPPLDFCCPLQNVLS